MLRCNNSTALEDFSDGILVDSKHSNRLDNGDMEISMDSDQPSRRHNVSAKCRSTSPKQPIYTKRLESQQDDRNIANVVLITGLSSASDNIQIQALELLRTKRIFTHTAVHTAPKTFLLVVLTSSSEPLLNHHLVGLVTHSSGTGLKSPSATTSSFRITTVKKTDSPI